MTTFSPLSRGRYRCKHPGCKAVVKKAALDRHRGNHWKNPGTRPLRPARARPKFLTDEFSVTPSPAMDVAIARALGGPIMPTRSMAGERRRGWWNRSHDVID